MDYEKKAIEFVREQLLCLDYTIQPHIWLKALWKTTKGNWMMQPSGSGTMELVDMTHYGTKKFKNKYMIIGHENFYRKFCEEVGIV